LANNTESGSEKEIIENYRKEITRERVACLLGSFLKSNQKQGALVDDFADWNEVGQKYVEPIMRLSAYDILRGELRDDRNTYIKPKDSITRVEAIALLDRFSSVIQLNYKY